MVVPTLNGAMPAMWIETAIDMLRQVPPAQLADQRRELHVAVGDRATEQFQAGYELGLETARVAALFARDPLRDHVIPIPNTKEG